MDMGIAGRLALVMGSSQGLGLASAQALAREGARVILTGRDAARLEAACATIRATGGTVEARVVDFADAAQVATLLEGLADTAIDILVTNGGGPPPGPIADVAPEVWQAQFDRMVTVPLRIVQAVLPGMRARGWGRIVNIVSSGVVQPIPNLGISNTLRMGLIGWAKTLATEVAADGVTVNSVVPGRIHTTRVDQLDAAAAGRTGKTVEEVAAASRATIPMRRYGHPDEFAAAVCFLSSAVASYMTGSMMRVDGGMIRSC
ncbi:SDR family oxidoreductase [Komagataeibacter sp. FNDCF1]|uniref:SDR family oxidoreductase n=1 Tax=Komagataeibacter sp. FNDCF1 TaxID=2878681 RepID=UPI001E5942B2|nr:SDR family oxidoreductase [Komagataeibacter sp. FNDCF1]MCE2563252.1 SDR family oxidoreductase [Komagataeibacter sp. FNDCF1]